MPCRFNTGNLLQQRDCQTGSPRCRIHPRTPCRPSRQTAHPPRHTITAISCAERDTNRLPGRKLPQILLGWCSEAVPGRKRCLFLRGTGYQPPAERENTRNPARKVLRGGSGQKKASFPARNGIPTARRAGKCPSTCADGSPCWLRAEKGIFSGAE